MKAYDPEQPLISLHVPKCAGQSFRGLLRHWYGDRLLFHYFHRQNAPPPRYILQPRTCVHGHFNCKKGLGVDAYYPGAVQFITILRDPLEIALSNYFYWKRKARQLQIERGTLRQGDEHDYRDIDDFLRKRSRSHLLNFLPAALTRDNYREFLEARFVWIGLVENLDETVPVLAGRLGFAPVALEWRNASPRDEEPSPAVTQAFIRENPLEFEIVRHVRDQWQEQGIGRPPGAGENHG